MKSTTKNKFFILSLIANVIMFLMLAFVAWYKWDGIKNKINTFVAGRKLAKETSQTVLSNFNKEPYVASNDFYDAGSEKTVSILILGNSLTITGAPEEEPDKELRGMVSSHKENDYVHLLVKKIATEKNVNVNYSFLNIADFERHYSEYPFDKSRLAYCTVQNPDYLIVQIGENVSDIRQNGELFEKLYIELLADFPESTKIITLPFWPDKLKINHITNVAVKSGAYLVDISHLGSGIDAENFAYYTKNYKVPGVGMHPGDYGMKNIADCIYTVFANQEF